jgi:hypothetical protein
VTLARSYTLRSHLLPWMLAAVLLRAFIPPGFMPEAGGMISSAMCSTLGSASETVEVPGFEVPGSGDIPHCDFCLSPATGLMPAERPPSFTIAHHGAVMAPLPASAFSSLLRAQSARGPPVA